MKTSEVIGKALDWAVAKAEGYELGCGGVVPYSADWSQGGPIIEQEIIAIVCVHSVRGNYWAASKGSVSYEETTEHTQHDPMLQIYKSDAYHGPTPLIAAMRCYVASKLGAEIELPKELTQ